MRATACVLITKSRSLGRAAGALTIAISPAASHPTLEFFFLPSEDITVLQALLLDIKGLPLK